MSLGVDSLLSANARVVFFFATIYLGAAGHLWAQITQTAYVEFGFSAGDYGSIAMLDTATQKFAGQTNVKGTPTAITVSPNGLLVYFTSSFDNFAGEFDTVSRRSGTIPVGAFPAGVTVAPDGLHAYVANEGGNTVSVIDTATQSVINNIEVGHDPTSVAFSPDGLTAYVANFGDRALAMNTYAGGTNINGGTLAVTTGVGSGPLSFHSGTLEVLSSGGGITLTNAITLNGGGGTFLADAGTTSMFSGVINGNGPLIKDGPETLILTGTNTYTGGTDINSGTVVVNNYSNLGKGPIRLRGGTLKVLNPK